MNSRPVLKLPTEAFPRRRSSLCARSQNLKRTTLSRFSRLDFCSKFEWSGVYTKPVFSWKLTK